jgi:hypothetical protein
MSLLPGHGVRHPLELADDDPVIHKDEMNLLIGLCVMTMVRIAGQQALSVK